MSGGSGEVCGAVSPNVKGRPTWAVARGWAGETSRLEGQARFELSHRNGASLHTVQSQNQEGLTAEG